MQARECFLCGTRHWSTQPCPAASKDRVQVRDELLARLDPAGPMRPVGQPKVLAKRLKVPGRVVAVEPVAVPVKPKRKKRSSDEAFDRVAYQREYMKNWRAKQKEKTK